ncbi:MAG: energy-coupling factor transporter transmembrane component T family protein [Christensenellales bacterium]
MAMSDMTLGQYIPADSLMHRMDARVKILLALAFMVLVFLVNTVQGYAMVFVLLIAAVALSKVPVKYVLKGLKPIIFILILTFLLNLLLTPGSTIWWQWGILKITKEGFLFAIQMAIRLALLVAGTSMLTLTTAFTADRRLRIAVKAAEGDRIPGA